MKDKSIPNFSTSAAYIAWFEKYCDDTLTPPSVLQTHQVSEYNRLQCEGPLWKAFPDKFHQGLWTWPPVLPRRIK